MSYTLFGVIAITVLLMFSSNILLPVCSSCDMFCCVHHLHSFISHNTLQFNRTADGSRISLRIKINTWNKNTVQSEQTILWSITSNTLMDGISVILHFLMWWLCSLLFSFLGRIWVLAKQHCHHRVTVLVDAGCCCCCVCDNLRVACIW